MPRPQNVRPPKTLRRRARLDLLKQMHAPPRSPTGCSTLATGNWTTSPSTEDNASASRNCSNRHLLHRHGTVQKNLLQHQTRTKTRQTQIHSRHPPRQTLLHREPRRKHVRSRVATRRLHLHRQPRQPPQRSHPGTREARSSTSTARSRVVRPRPWRSFGTQKKRSNRARRLGHPQRYHPVQRGASADRSTLPSAKKIRRNARAGVRQYRTSTKTPS